MIILGAGASCTYGYPSGPELAKQICDGLQHAPSQTNPNIELFVQMGFFPDIIAEFVDSLKNCGRDTIDEYLKNNPRFNRIGKYAIAWALIRHENTNRLMVGNSKNNLYKHLFTAMTEDIDTIDQIINNKISFIIFNYDRSLEQFFYTVLKKLYGENKDEQKIFEILKKLPIIHVHGQIGFMPWQNQNHREYAAQLNAQNIKTTAENIGIFTEIKAEHNNFLKARDLINKANIVCFLGFGFHPYNMEKLNATYLLKNKKIIGTGQGISQKRKRDIVKITENAEFMNLSEGSIEYYLDQQSNWL